MLILASCSEKKGNKQTPEKKDEPIYLAPIPSTPTLLIDDVGYDSMSAIQLLDLLIANIDSHWVMVDKAPYEWIKPDDIDSLVKLIRSKEPCAGLILKSSNIYPPNNVQSTVGVEAMLMIDSYRKGWYPAFNSTLDYSKELTPDAGTKKLLILPQPALVRDIEQWYNSNAW
ncbi:MAG: hypothetical protein SFW35_13085 [Chitinophagales bacterium]|nr:hypothetical protein [Chitinophagales bacterium]